MPDTSYRVMNGLSDLDAAGRKTAVDPVKGSTVRLNSDEFVKTNTRKFDVIWIDGQSA